MSGLLLDAMRAATQAQMQQRQGEAFQRGLMVGAPPMPAAPPPMTYFPGMEGSYDATGGLKALSAPPMKSGGGK